MDKNSTLTARQRRFLNEIISYIQREGRPPTTRELKEIMDFRSPRSVSQFLQVLEERGYIKRGHGARNITVHKPSGKSSSGEGRTIQVPIVGVAPCGLPLLAEQNVEGFVRISIRLARPPYTYFALKTVGDSMNKAGIERGDLVIVRQQPTAKDGDRVVALIDDEATIKEVKIQSRAVLLRPRSTNKSHKPILVTNDFQIQGIVIGTVRDWEKG